MLDSVNHVEAGDLVLGHEAMAVLSPMAGERERIREIKAAFPNDPDFALQAIEAGHSLLEARAASCDHLTEKLRKQHAESAARIADLERQLEQRLRQRA